jgi:hypothetical protein
VRVVRKARQAKTQSEKIHAQSDMIVAAMLSLSLAAELIVGSALKLRIVAPLGAVCPSIVVVIPAAAARSKLHMPAYTGIAILAFAASLVLGEMSGAQRIAGSIAGVILSSACFLSISVFIGSILGSILALFFYRDLPEA